MRVVNRHTARVAEIAPGEAGEVDESKPGVKVFLEAGLLVDAETIEQREPELTLDRAKEMLDDAARAFDAQREELAKSRESVNDLAAKLADARKGAANLQAIADTNASELAKAHQANATLSGELTAARARIAELEAQLAAKAESAPAPGTEPTSAPEAPAKKGKG